MAPNIFLPILPQNFSFVSTGHAIFLIFVPRAGFDARALSETGYINKVKETSLSVNP